jgi:cell division protein ZapA
VEKKRVTVTISGKDYSIVSGVEPEYIKKVASYLNDKMREISDNYPNIPETKVAVLAALNITDELFQSRRDGPVDGASEAIIGELTRKLSEIL